MARPNLPPELERKYNEDLRATLRRVGLLRIERRETGKALKEVIETEVARSLVLLDLLDGKITEQQALPGIEETVTAREQTLGATLRRAIDSARRICGIDDPLVERELEDLDEAAGMAGRGDTTITLTTPEGKSVTATSAQMRRALDDLKAGKRGAATRAVIAQAAHDDAVAAAGTPKRRARKGA